MAPRPRRVYGADFTYPPLPGARSRASSATPGRSTPGRSGGLEHSFRRGVMSRDHGPQDDAPTPQGRFRLVGFPKGRGNQLLIAPNDDQPYFMQEVAVPDPPGIAPVSVEIGLASGDLDRRKSSPTRRPGEPVAGAWLHYLPVPG